MSGIPSAVRVAPEDYQRLLAVVHELEHVQGRRVPMWLAFAHVLAVYDEHAESEDRLDTSPPNPEQ